MSKRELQFVHPAGHTITVDVIGQGRPFFLLHGFPLDAALWQDVAPELAAQGRQVLMPHLRGFGRSSSITSSLTIADLADDVELVRQFVCPDQKIELLGLSLGGYVAFEYWSQYAEHLSALILTNTKPQADSPEARQARLTMADKAMQESTWAATAPMLEKLLSAKTISEQPEIKERIQAMMSGVSPSTIYFIQHAMAQRRDFTAQLHQIKLPTLVMTGELDPISPPADNRLWSQMITSAHLKIVAGASHLPSVEQPEAFVQAINQFLMH